MPRANVLSTALDLAPPREWLSSLRRPQQRESESSSQLQESPQVDPELKLPPLPSLIIVLTASTLLQVCLFTDAPTLECLAISNALSFQLSFFIIVSSSNAYAHHLGGTSTFAGLVIGIPTVFSGLTLLPLLKLDRGGYSIPLHCACGASVLGHVLYALAYRANFLYLIFISRIVSGFGFTFWMYAKRYCSDHRIVGIRRRTMLAGWLVVGQALGFSLGPFVGGLL